MLMAALKIAGGTAVMAIVGMGIIGPKTIRAMMKASDINGIYSIDVDAGAGRPVRTIRYDTSHKMVQAKLLYQGAPVRDVLMYMGVYPVTLPTAWYSKAKKPMDIKAVAVASLFPLRVNKTAKFSSIDFGGGMQGLKMACTHSRMTVKNRVTGTRGGQKWDIYQIEIVRSIDYKEDSGPDAYEKHGAELAATGTSLDGKKDVNPVDILKVSGQMNAQMFGIAGELLKRTAELKRRQREEPGFDACALPEWIASTDERSFAPETVTVWYDAIHDIPVGMTSSIDPHLDFPASKFLATANIRSAYKDEVRDIGRWVQ
jgi:hypothetical protein